MRLSTLPKAYDSDHQIHLGSKVSVRKPRLLFVLQQALGWSTFALQIQNVLRERTDIETKVVPVPPYRWFSLPYKRQHMAQQEKFYRLLDPIRGFEGFLGNPIRAEINSFKPDLVHFSGQYPAAAFRRDMGCSVVTATFDSTRVSMEEQTRGAFWSEANFAAERELLNGIDYLFPMTDWAARSAIEDYDVPESKMEIIFPSLDPKAVGTRETQGRSPVPRVIFIGNDFVRKGGDRLFRWATGPLAGQFELHIVSRHPSVRTLKAPGVVVHGAVPHDRLMRDILPNMDLLCLPTRSEMSAYVLVEAALAGVPALTSALGGITELIRQDETGWALPAEDDRAFTDCLGNLCKFPNLIAVAGLAARKRALVRMNAVTNYNQMFDRQLELLNQKALVG